MGQADRTLTELGRHVARRQDEAPEAVLHRERGRERLRALDLDAVRGATRRTRRLRIARLFVPIAAALALALAVVALALPRTPLSYRVGDDAMAQAGVAGAWIAAPRAEALPIRFSDGSVLRLAAGGRARVASTGANGAEIALERGSLDLSVVHRPETRWRVQVGPFLIHVVGTRFETSWDPTTERFSVALREGAIRVSGPVVGDARDVHTGERIDVSNADRSLTVSSVDVDAANAKGPPAPAAVASQLPRAVTPADLPDVEPDEHPRPEATAPSGAPSAEATALPVAPPEASAAPSWRALALDAKYKDAVAAAEAEGIDAILSSASASDLHLLGDAARLGGSSKRAQQAFVRVLDRFPGSADAGYAAFMLGRAAQDQSKDYAGAAAWFGRYLREQPGGRFAEEASGRLVEVTDRMGDEAGARRAAERYLARYPSGSHAEYARRVLARAAP